jgi:hypothetical protein
LKNVSVATFLILITVLHSDCTSSRHAQLVDVEYSKLNNCKKQWVYHNLTDTTELKVLLFNKKGRYHLSSWPNFLIGINSKGDTIGVIDGLSNEDFNNGITVRFTPHNYGDDIDKVLNHHPTLVVHKRDEKNKLYCSINRVFYGKVE